MDAGPRPTLAEMAQLVEMLRDAGLVELYLNDEGHETYRLTHDGVKAGHMLGMVDGLDVDKVLEGAIRT